MDGRNADSQRLISDKIVFETSFKDALLAYKTDIWSCNSNAIVTGRAVVCGLEGINICGYVARQTRPVVAVALLLMLSFVPPTIPSISLFFPHLLFSLNNKLYSNFISQRSCFVFIKYELRVNYNGYYIDKKFCEFHCLL